MRKIAAYFLLSIFLVLTGCTKTPSPNPSGSPPLVVVSIPPYKQFVTKIAGKTVNVISAVPDQYDPHVFELTPGKLNELTVASLWIGVHEPFEEKIVPILQRDNASFKYLDLTTRVPLIKFTEDTKQLVDDGHHHHDDEKPCCSKEGYDRHIWMSPKLALLQAKNIKNALVDMFPEFATLYEENYLQFLSELKELNRDLEKALAPFRGDSILVNHASLGYFCHDFGLHQLAIEVEGKALLPHQLKKIESTVHEAGISCMLVMPQFEDKGAVEIAKQLDLKIARIDPLEADYLTNLRFIASVISGCKPTRHVAAD